MHNYSYLKISDTNTLQHKYITLTHKTSKLTTQTNFRLLLSITCRSVNILNSQDFNLNN